MAKEKVAAKKPSPGTPEDPVDHSKTASEIAGNDPKGKAAAASLDAVSKTDKAKEDQEQTDIDNSIVGKIRKSGLHFVRNHVTGQDYVGIPPNNDPNASEAEKRLSAVTALDSVSPRTGMIVKPASGDSFSVGEGFGPEKVPADWAAVTRPDGSPLFA